MEQMTWQVVQTVVMAVLAVAGALVTIGKALEVVRGWLKPRTDESRDVRRNAKRIDALEKSNADNRAGIKALCAGVRALLEHELHNGNADELKKASEAIEAWVNDHI